MEEKQFKKTNLAFQLFTLLVFLSLLIPKMVQEGLFMDGMLYSCVSKNLANGYGTFWFPKFNELGIGGLSTFHEHPPLVFGIQSLFFMVFGNGFYVEKIFSLFTALVTVSLMVLIWKILFKDHKDYSQLSWLPVLYWIIMPIVFFSYQNNLMENSMGIFTLLAVYFALQILINKNTVWLNLIFSGIAVFLASFSKGIPGFFPVVVFGLWWLIKRTINFRQMITYTLVLILIPTLLYSLLFLFSEDASDSLSNYLFGRALNRISNAPTVDSRFHVLGKVVVETIPTIMLTLIILIVDRFKIFRSKTNKSYLADILFIFSIGLAGTIPLMLTLVQKSFYFIHALPFFALAMAMLSAKSLVPWLKRINPETMLFKVFKISLLLGIIGVLAYSVTQFGKVERDQDLLHDVHILGQEIPEMSTVRIDSSMYNNFSLHCYMIRYYTITMDFKSGSNFILLDKGLNLPVNNTYKRKELPLKLFELYEIEE